MINVKGVNKKYGKKNVLNEMNLQVSKGEVHGLLGKNGAGKSTFIKILLGLGYADSGRIEVFGKAPGKENYRIGYLSENITLYPHLSAADNIRIAALSSDTKIDRKRIKQILAKINMEDVGNKPVRKFSLGMKRRLQLAMTTMIKKFDLLILDEPTNGLDINGMIWLKNYLNELRNEGTAMLIASHAIADMQDVLTHYDILSNGSIVLSGSVDKDSTKQKYIEIKVTEDELEKTIELVESKIEKYEVRNKKIIVMDDITTKSISTYLFENGVIPESVIAVRESLEDIFVTATSGSN